LHFGVEDPDYNRRIYSELAELTQRADDGDPQRWLELRYRARAADHEAVTALITPERFRLQLAAGRATAEIQADIRLAFRSVKERRDHVGLVGLLLSRHEIDRRADVLGNCGAIADAHLALGDLGAALAVLEEGGAAIKHYEVIDALLRSGRMEDARREFEMIEPLGKLLGTEPVAFVRHENELFAWAGRVHHFREPDQILEAIERLTDDDRGNPFRESEIRSLRANLRHSVALAVVTTNPRADLDQVVRDLKIDDAVQPYLLSGAAWSAYHEGDNVLAAKNLFRAIESSNTCKVSHGWRRNTGLLAFRLGEIEAARTLFEGLETPSLAQAESAVGEEVVKDIAREVVTHASFAARLGAHPSAAAEARHQLLRPFQRHLMTVGRLIGEARNGRRWPAHLVAREVRTILIFLNQATGNNSDGVYPAYQVRSAAPVLGAAIVEAAVAHGALAFNAVMAELDAVTSMMFPK
jgi:tetratricopeptide (TPR) repeat protein